MTPSTSDRLRAAPPAPRRLWLRDVCFDERLRRRAVWLFGLLSLLFILVVAFFSFQNTIPAYDQYVTEELQELDVAPVTTVSELVSLPGYSPWNAMIAAACCILVGIWLNWKVGLYLTVITLLQGIVGVLLKFPIRVDRPMETDLNAPLAVIKASSFPSGHTTMYVVLFGFVVYLLWKYCAPALLRVGGLIVAALLIALVGPARIHVGAHWLGDVIAAYLMGFFFLLLSVEVYERYVVPRLGLDERRTWP